MSQIVVGLLTLGIAFCQTSPSRQVPPAGRPEQEQQGAAGPIRRIINGNVKLPKLVIAPEPTIPPLAKAARIHGIVSMEAEIDERGRVASLRVLAGHPFLIASALEAAKQYQYVPVAIQNTPIRMFVTISIQFKTEVASVEPLPLQ